MSSTTDRRDRGQVLVIFALTLITLLLFAALAYDTGMVLLEKRTQQNASDAAAIAGSRYLPGDAAAAEAAAISVAADNGFTDGVDSDVVFVSVPPTTGPHAGNSAYIEVRIGSTRPSIFAGVIQMVDWDVAARAVATNQDSVAAPYAMLSLEPDDCDGVFVSGNGDVTANGNIQVNSTCDHGALRRQGGGTINITAAGAACNVVGDIQSGGGGALNCVPNEGAAAAPDPLLTLPAPAVPSAATTTPLQVGGGTMTVPAGCPGGASAGTALLPATCQFNSSYSGTTWRLYAGYYPGGIKLQGGTFYMEPGVYILGGGGFVATGSGATVITVAAGGTTLDRGIMLYNTEAFEFSDECEAGTLSAADALIRCIQPIVLNGSDATIDIYPMDTGAYDGISIFQDRDLEIPGDDVIIDGSSSNTQVRGTMYLPTGDIRVNGSGGTVTVDQVIANTFQVNGAPGSHIDVLFDLDFVHTFDAAGLIE